MRISDWSSERVLFRSFQCVAEDGVTTAPGNMTSVSTAINTRFDIYDNGWAAGCGGACPAAQNTGKDLVRTNAAPGGNNCALHNQGWRQVAAAGRYLPDPVTRTDNNVTAMGHPRDVRSEEHTSELQSLMRISY